MHGIALPLTTLLVAALFVGTGPASAIYVQTPLILEAADREVDAGDSLTFTIRAQNASEADRWAGATVKVLYAWDANESGEGAGSPDDSVDSSSFQERVLVEDLVLGDTADASFEWVVPEEVDGHNVDVIVFSADDERVAFDYVAVGDAPPKMRMMAGSGPAPEPDQGAREPDTTEQDSGADASADDTAGASEELPRKDTPAVGVLAAVGALGALAVAFRRK